MLDIGDLQDLLAEAGSNKELLIPHLEQLLDALLDTTIVLHKVVYKVMAALVLLIREGIMQTHGEAIFGRTLDLFEMMDEARANEEPQIKKALEEVASSLFCNSCSYLQMQPTLIVQYLPYILTVMPREGSTRFAGYGCVAPLLLQNIQAFSPYVELLLKAMLYFPGEVLSVISQLYKLQPEVFDSNIPLLIQLYGESPAAQLSILHILHEIGLRNESLVKPYLLKLREMCDTVQTKDESIVPIQEFVEDRLQNVLINSGAVGGIGLEANGFAASGDEFAHSGSEEIVVENQSRDGSPSPSIKGALRKRGRVFGRLSRRWFTLDEGAINFYKNSKKETPTRRIALNEVIKVTPDTRHPHAFVVQTKSRSVLFSASSDKEKEMWVSAIEKFSRA